MKHFLKNKKRLLIIIFVSIILLSLSGKDKNDTSQIQTESEIPQDEAAIIRQKSEIKPKPRGDRVVGLGISEGGVGFEKAFSLAKSAGVQAIELPTSWNDGEPEYHKYVAGWLPIADSFYPKAGIKIGISLNPIDTNNLRLPKDLQNKSLNDPQVIERYKAFVDFAADQLRESDVFFVSIGNEIDAYLGNSDTRWQEYTEFFVAVAPYVREKFPKAVVGSKITYDGLINLHKNAERLNEHSDAILTTYYPFQSGGFDVRDPSAVHSDFKRIVELYPEKKIYFAEIGYPSGGINKSSEEKQAQFVKEAFAAWDTYASRIAFLNFQWLHDASPETVSNWQKYYGLKDKGFASFLGTIGLRTYDGKDKKAFLQFQQETKSRGW